MKQRLLLILSLLLMVAMSQAAPVDANKAKDKALQFLSGKQAKARGMEQGTTPDVQLVTSEGDSYYVFNVGQQNGFVIVSGDDRAPEILGYSDSGSFDTQTIPENMRAWLQGYAEQIQLLDQVEAPAAARAATPARETPWAAIDPLIQTKWDQQGPYNNLLEGNVVTVTGAQGKVLQVVSLTGRLLATYRISSPSQRVELNLSKGCYILKVDKVVRKVSIQ